MKRVLVLIVLLVGLAPNAWADVLAGARAYRDGNDAVAFYEFRVLAMRGDPMGQYALGLMHAERQRVRSAYDPNRTNRRSSQFLSDAGTSSSRILAVALAR